MKIIYFDVDGVFLSKDGQLRPYMDVVLEFCIQSSIRIFIGAPEGPEYAHKIFATNYPELVDKMSGFFRSNTELDRTPSLYISCNSETLKTSPGIIVPFFRPNVHNKFACLALAGRLLESIRDKIVTNKENKGTPKQQKKKQSNVRPEPPEHPYDTSQWGVSI